MRPDNIHETYFSYVTDTDDFAEFLLWVLEQTEIDLEPFAKKWYNARYK